MRLMTKEGELQFWMLKACLGSILCVQYCYLLVLLIGVQSLIRHDGNHGMEYLEYCRLDNRPGPAI